MGKKLPYGCKKKIELQMFSEHSYLNGICFIGLLNKCIWCVLFLCRSSYLDAVTCSVEKLAGTGAWTSTHSRSIFQLNINCVFYVMFRLYCFVFLVFSVSIHHMYTNLLAHHMQLIICSYRNAWWEPLLSCDWWQQGLLLSPWLRYTCWLLMSVFLNKDKVICVVKWFDQNNFY